MKPGLVTPGAAWLTTVAPGRLVVNVTSPVAPIVPLWLSTFWNPAIVRFPGALPEAPATTVASPVGTTVPGAPGPLMRLLKLPPDPAIVMLPEDWMVPLLVMLEPFAAMSCRLLPA